MNWEKNETCTVEITGYNGEGAGVARLDGRVIFVPNTIVGEIWEIVLVKVKKNLVFARAITCLQPSDQRLEQDCQFSGKCGGCQFRHMSYQEEKNAKSEILASALGRIGGVDTQKILPIFGGEEVNHYRNKVQYQVAGSDKWVKIGFYRARSHDLLDVEQCLLQKECSTVARQVLKTWMVEHRVNPYDEATGKGSIRHLFLRTNQKGESLLCLVATREKLPKREQLVELWKEALPGLVGVVLNVHKKDSNVVLGEEYHCLWGQDFLLDSLCGLEFKLSVPSFFQVNTPQAEVLYSVVKKFALLTGKETVLDLYCGTGTIGLSLAKEAKQVVGVEIVEKAVENAKENAFRNQIDNATFFQADSGSVLSLLQKEKVSPDVVVVDPPRKGLSAGVTDLLLALSVEKLVYVSCDPGTLARDLKTLEEQGFQVAQVQPVDMFPRTRHVECVVQLVKK